MEGFCLRKILHFRIFIWKSFLDYHKVEGIDEPQCFARFRELHPTFEGAYDLTKVKLNTMINVYYIYANIRNFMRTIPENKSQYAPYFSSWTYYLFYVLDLI